MDRVVYACLAACLGIKKFALFVTRLIHKKRDWNLNQFCRDLAKKMIKFKFITIFGSQWNQLFSQASPQLSHYARAIPIRIHVHLHVELSVTSTQLSHLAQHSPQRGLGSTSIPICFHVNLHVELILIATRNHIAASFYLNPTLIQRRADYYLRFICAARAI